MSKEVGAGGRFDVFLDSGNKQSNKSTKNKCKHNVFIKSKIDKKII